MRAIVDYLLSRKGKKVGMWLWSLAGISGFLISIFTGQDIPPGAVTLYCFVWGFYTGHNIAEVVKGAKDGNPG